MRIHFALFLIVMLAACTGTETDSDISSIDPNFFNLTDYVELQKTRLANTPITKTVSVNGIEETQKITAVDWELELAPFVQSNIDRPALWDSYAMDSVSCQGLKKLVYLSNDADNFTKSLEVTYVDVSKPLDSVYAVYIRNGFESYIANTSQQLIFWDGGYEIRSTQAAVLSEERALNIIGTWKAEPAGACVKTSFFESSSSPGRIN